jgi:hypothetical protein
MKVACWVLSDSPMKMHHNCSVGRAREAERRGIGHHAKNVVLGAAAVMARGLLN